jgi:hypothetical protein
VGVLAEDGDRVDDEPFEGEAIMVGWWGGCSSSQRASSRNVVTIQAGAEEGLGRWIIRERRENADSVSDKETVDSVVRGRHRDFEGDLCTWVGVVEDGRVRERLDWENCEGRVRVEVVRVFAPFAFSLDAKS